MSERSDRYSERRRRLPAPVTGLEVGKLPPQSPDIERVVLGALMLEKDALKQVSDLLIPETFYVTAHQIIFRAIAEVHATGIQPDIMTVTMALKKSGELDIVGGPFYISQLTNKVASATNVFHHALLLVQQHMLRKIIHFGSTAVSEAYDETSDVFEVIDGVEQGLRECAAYIVPRHTITAGSFADALVLGVKPDFIRFNSPGLEHLMCQSGLVHTVGGRTGLGKSIFSTEEAWGWTKLGRVLMFSPEMTERQITSRILARESGVPYTTVLAGEMTEQEQALVSAARVRVADRLDNNMILDPTESITPKQMRARIDRAMADGPLVAVVIDHLHEMTSGIPKIDNEPSSRPKVSYCISQVNSMAKRLHVPFLVMAQLNRDVEKRTNKRPVISDLFWSSDIDQKSAMIILLYREGYYLPNPPFEDELEMIVAKNRDGAVRTYTAPITPAFSRIGPPPSDYAAPRPPATVPVPHPDQQHAPRGEEPEINPF